ncbi:MAG: hypothetical protein WDM92_15455 [Caulobacteraceae bacterium]
MGLAAAQRIGPRQAGHRRWSACRPPIPAKFPETVLAATGVEPIAPPQARALAGKPERFDRLPADRAAVKAYVTEFLAG